MTCAQVLDLIDAAPLAEARPGRMDAARRHATTCPACAAAFAREVTLSAELRRLRVPAEGPDMAAAVMARIARLDEAAASGSAPVSASSGTHVWIGTVAGGLLVTGAVFGVLDVSGGAGDLMTGVRIGPSGAGLQPAAVSVLLAGLLLYARSLLASAARGVGRRR